MKRTAKFFLGSLLTTLLVATAACKPSSEPTTTTPNDSSTPDIVETTTSEETSVAAPSIKDDFDCITIARAIEIANKAGETATTESYYVYGKIKEVVNPMYGEVIIQDETGELYIYGIKEYSNLEDKPLKGDEVVLYGQLKMYSGKAEMGKADLKAFKKAEKEPIDVSNYTQMSVKEARQAAPEALVKMSGVVASITRTQKNVPNGFILIDNSESIYVYGQDIVQEVHEGQEVTVAGKRVNYVSSKETESAARFGYQGCIQVSEAILVKGGENKELPLNWVKETTVKEILDTPLTTNITSTTYKVHAFVHKSEGSGFTNYYIDDLDDKTGTYVYTSNSGSDFAWLDPFDNKLCDLLLSPLNVKCSAGSYNYRFHPITCEESTYKVADKDMPNFGLTYYVNDQFLPEYNADPALKVVTTATNEKIGMGEVKFTYASNNTDIIEFKNNASGVLVMHAKADGTAKVSITATYKDFTATLEKDLKVKLITVEGALDVASVLAKEDNTAVTVKGIVMSSLVNQTGFYIADETGIIAVRSDAETVSTLRVGNYVYFEGLKTHFKKNAEKPDLGQIVIDQATLVLNSYGEHDIPKNTFITDKTLKDLTTFDACADDMTAQAFTVQAKIVVVESAYYTNIMVQDPTDENITIRLYSSSAKQYQFLKQFADKVVSLDIALCNWNNKTYYTGCVISATDGTNTVYNTLNFGA